ncbi:hypothetical protein [Lacrimispora sp.]|uniref:hypothetical protein n=1 Tax=Lacrimispora sp. TaxID=2719234 RepID=UPI0028A1BED9|nr:hypothetical protein [Lacrimispora sp.]
MESLKYDPVTSRRRPRRKNLAERTVDALTWVFVGLMYIATCACTVLGVLQVMEMIVERF